MLRESVTTTVVLKQNNWTWGDEVGWLVAPTRGKGRLRGKMMGVRGRWITEAKRMALVSARNVFGQPLLDKTYTQVGLDSIGNWEMDLEASLSYTVKFYCKN